MAESIPISEGSVSVKEVFESVEVSIAELCAKARAQYAHKNFEQAADLYSRATELQAELNGEMNPDNAEILFLYGRSLFKLGQSKSDVLGGRPSGEKMKHAPRKLEGITEENKPQEIEDSDNSLPVKPQESVAPNVETESISEKKKPLFQFTGDDNFEESDEEEAESDEENEDDLAAAFDVLDLAKVLFKKKLEANSKNEDNKKTIDSSMLNHIKERLADTHDLLAEISLENEQFSAAVSDGRAALAYKQELYSEDRNIIAEAHFKLSLALEFASITSSADTKNQDGAGDTEIDQTLRNEAIKEMEAAINSTNLKLQAKELELQTSNPTDDNEATRGQISEVKEMLADLQNRLEELKGPAIDVKSALYGSLVDKGGILGATALGESPSDVTARIEDAKKTATDVTGLTRKKVKVSDSNTANRKRKAEDVEEKSEKKVKFEASSDTATDTAVV
ncbi:hypothetical protein K3495_g4568 [Podosphaera aphanis]|nr:hypothetical protein K3495_g4568 [Podosphaera aphanis]